MRTSVVTSYHVGSGRAIGAPSPSPWRRARCASSTPTHSPSPRYLRVTDTPHRFLRWSRAVKINRRLALLVTAPLAVAVTFSGLALAPAASDALQADRLTAMVKAAAGAAELAEKLQHERVAATALVSGQGDPDRLRESAEATDESVDRFRQEVTDLSEVPDNAQVMLDRIERSVEKLVSLRAQARSGSSTISALAFGYRIVIADLIGYRDGIAQAEGVDAHIADRIRAAAALSEAAEYTAQEQVTVMRAQAAGASRPPRVGRSTPAASATPSPSGSCTTSGPASGGPGWNAPSRVRRRYRHAGSRTASAVPATTRTSTSPRRSGSRRPRTVRSCCGRWRSGSTPPSTRVSPRNAPCCSGRPAANSSWWC